ncbi:TPA: helix-turn-helix domain-containing protein [Pseudomonas aeruginosa]|uniref:helix-turn-helix domain-containing protein n=1 Tax=Pseudomonas aeruginosa TaxID=287 RepID=UPI000F846B64|nr:helix-turn-helix domain-containing protein [Pseudomonas aeruginosa]MBG5667275.1 helix-turn-helix domain-containing protein [Pseudomonas aeruginosa]MDG4091736.1 helix-turn-helix domain-containing protein [Pseudomonas aeruginosa]RTT51497.1 helix-turn-helix domain-containing protein [Pseudomonas aeruginosa]HCE6930710.1 helix-turn-helix domain-containing protein [Pseudomonas aeruginosa]HCE8530466.1 helix-turn-helix domain-containing protein [Pseudomonas aeruginosa]
MMYLLDSNSSSNTEPRPSINLLPPAEFEALNARISANADQWLADKTAKTKNKIERKPKGNRGRKPKMIANPFYGFIGPHTYWEPYPEFALDIIEGVARLNWYGEQEQQLPLSVAKINYVLETLPIITNDTVGNLLQLRERHASRYVKAVEMIIPWMMKSRPKFLISEMDGIDFEPKACGWEDCDDACPPSPEELAKLHHDLRTLTEYKTAEEYEEDYPTQPGTAAIVTLPNRHAPQQRQQHPKKTGVLELLAQGKGVKTIERETGVSAKTIRRWRDEMQTAQVELKAA